MYKAIDLNILGSHLFCGFLLRLKACLFHSLLRILGSINQLIACLASQKKMQEKIMELIQWNRHPSNFPNKAVTQDFVIFLKFVNHIFEHWRKLRRFNVRTASQSPMSQWFRCHSPSPTWIVKAILRGSLLVLNYHLLLVGDDVIKTIRLLTTRWD